ncbi:beta-galactosidase [Streptomyces sp. WAC04189]|uniref:beta-galactosidase n=1 Tax=Streptomyces TaxID=1883 RepID=UPI000FBE13A5|nr:MULTISPECIES: beta-galactosidase [Streptomyces]MCC8451171.1 beta-galactosidase [Streptomyces rochei]RSS02143.1 beta-galactosidase [Streptomyces sp. WAC04189]RSS28178.1 beta-galactosidase [Streptomyces sp. WAC08452]
MLSLHAHDPSAPLAGHLPLGSPAGTPSPVTVDSQSLSRDGRRWIPVMGEFHFSRCPAAEWREELLKIKAGGVDLLATYLFWNQHENDRGTYRFDGDLDVRGFVTLCAELDLAVAVRIGPWSHGECRNGGFPDWLEDVDCAPRTDDPAYLALVAPYYRRISHELRGLFHEDGGPIVAVQVENELYDQPEHLATLRRMAEEAGIRAPLWTATGWGAADIPADTLLPLYGGYPEAFWEDAHDGWARDMRRHYFFTPIRDDHAIGADLRSSAPTGTGPDARRYPYATCELGGGMAIAYHRRPLVPAADITSLALTKLGSGSVWQGYYLYHGCSQRVDLKEPNQESHDTGYPNDLPTVTYDFQAPLGEYGQVRPAFHALRRQHLFLHAYGAELARMPLHLPDREPASLDDRSTLRWAVRSAGDQGFLFVNNHQPHETLPDHDGVRFGVTLPSGRTVAVPAQPVRIPSGAHFVWPIGLDLGAGLRLEWAGAEPVTRLEVDGLPLTVLAATDGVPATLALAADVEIQGPARVDTAEGTTLVTVTEPGTSALLTLTGPAGRARVLVLSPEHALRLNRMRVFGQDRLVLSDDVVFADGDRLRLHIASDAPSVALLPAPASLVGSGVGEPVADGVFTRWPLARAPRLPQPVLETVREQAVAAPARTGGSHDRASAPREADWDKAAVFRLTVPASALDGDGEVLLRLRCTGDAARAYLDGRLVADHFWYGPDWEIGLRRFADAVVRHGLEIRVLPRDPAARVYVDASVRPRFDAAVTRAAVESAALVAVPRVSLTAEGEGRV